MSVWSRSLRRFGRETREGRKGSDRGGGTEHAGCGVSKKNGTRSRRSSTSSSGLIDTENGQVALAMKQDLVRTHYMMYGGWACSVFLGVAIAAAYFLLKPVPSVPLEGDAERPTHRIE